MVGVEAGGREEGGGASCLEAEEPHPHTPPSCSSSSFSDRIYVLSTFFSLKHLHSFLLVSKASNCKVDKLYCGRKEEARVDSGQW